VRGLVIDPYNYLDMAGDSEHQAISKMLTDIVSGVACVIEFHCSNLRDYCDTPNNNLTFPTIE